jgi:hypothetical protein
MKAVSVPTRQARSHYRHELRTLVYVTLDEGNGGIIRNINHDGLSVQAVARLRLDQPVRLRFELRSPRLRVEAQGHVSWCNASGQCGIRFVNLPLRAVQQIDEWIFSNLLDALARGAVNAHPMFGAQVVSIARDQDDGLIVAASPRAAIRLEPSFAGVGETAGLNHRESDVDEAYPRAQDLNWLSRPLSARTIAWMVDGLVLIAAALLFGVIFLSIAHEVPEWRITLSAVFAAMALIAGACWILFRVVGRASLGARLTKAVSGGEEKG